ncbi:MAG: zinc ABC transporter substrate-binding protein [Nitrospinota bacterium]
MKHKIFVFLLFAIAFTNHSIASNHSISKNDPVSKNDSIVATIKPLHSLVESVVGDSGKVELLLQGSESPHTFQMKPSHLVMLHKGAVVFYIDKDLEFFLERVIRQLPKSVHTVEISSSLPSNQLLFNRSSNFDAQDKLDDKDKQHENHNDKHTADKHTADKHTADKHKEEDHHHHHASGIYDSHIWLDPDNAKEIVKIVRDRLIQLFPENKKIYITNSNNVIDRIDMLDMKIKKMLSNIKDRRFLAFHDAYQYFERHYNLKIVATILTEPNDFISASHLSKIRMIIEKQKIKCVFHEPQFSQKLTKNVTEGLDIETMSLDPVGASIKPGRNLYFKLMEQLATNIKRCMEQ